MLSRLTFVRFTFHWYLHCSNYTSEICMLFRPIRLQIFCILTIKIVTNLFKVWLALDKSIKSSSQIQLKQITREGSIKNTNQQCFQTGKYAVENGIATSVRKYQFNFRRKYEAQLRHSNNNACQEAAKGLTTEKRGHPFLLGKLDGMVQTYIQSASNRGAAVTR